MGKGDKKTKRGKIFMGTYGVRRPARKQNVVTVNVAKAATPADEKQENKTSKK